MYMTSLLHLLVREKSCTSKIHDNSSGYGGFGKWSRLFSEVRIYRGLLFRWDWETTSFFYQLCVFVFGTFFAWIGPWGTFPCFVGARAKLPCSLFNPIRRWMLLTGVVSNGMRCMKYSKSIAWVEFIFSSYKFSLFYFLFFKFFNNFLLSSWN